MQTLIVGMGALGGTIAARALGAGLTIRLAVRSADCAQKLQRSGLRVSGVGGPIQVDSIDVATLQEYVESGEHFDLVVLATKAQDALEAAPLVSRLLAPRGVLLPIQNGGVAQILSDQLGESHVLGGLSNLGATMVEPGVYEQKNAGHLLIGELAGGVSERVDRVALVLNQAIEVKVSSNLTGAIWSKIMINCAVTTVGAICSQTMRQYMQTSAGRKVFRRTYEEALSVALAIGIRPERLVVNPIPTDWAHNDEWSERYESWVNEIIAFYGDAKPSMLQDFERGRTTEIDFINGYVARVGREAGIPVHLNAKITEIVRRIERGEMQPSPELIYEIEHHAAGSASGVGTGEAVPRVPSIPSAAPPFPESS